MQRKCAVFSCLGLGDGLIAQVLSHNLSLNGQDVTTFHPSLSALQQWFSNSIRPFPSSEELEKALFPFDEYFLIFEKSPWMQEVLAFCQKHHRNKLRILNPIATPNKDYLYWEEGQFDGRKPFVDNLYNYCKDILKLPESTKSNGITPPKEFMRGRFAKRVVIHPTSTREGKNWPKEKYLLLAEHLEEMGYEPSFILSKEEKKGWDSDNAPDLSSLGDIAAHVLESGYMIGNDSGIGHLASCLGLPTVTICRSKMTANFWRPAWSQGEVLTPPPFIPNIKGMRLRDNHWKRFIGVKRVLKSFSRLAI